MAVFCPLLEENVTYLTCKDCEENCKELMAQYNEKQKKEKEEENDDRK